MAHTPGPWEHERDASDDSELIIISDNQYAPFVVATVHEITDDDEIGDAKDNARLIAAAPELLAALEDMLAGYEDTMNRYGHGAGHADDARAAIAKAKGTKTEERKEP